MFAVAIGAVRCVAHARSQRFAVDAFVELSRDFVVTPSAGRRDISVAHGRLRVARGKDVVAAVAVGANGRIFAL